MHVTILEPTVVTLVSPPRYYLISNFMSKNEEILNNYVLEIDLYIAPIVLLQAKTVRKKSFLQKIANPMVSTTLVLCLLSRSSLHTF